jgi:aspartyl-tRNA(Asn)/glutamyl-tRNA(Gln) amidotransferase subunit A
VSAGIARLHALYMSGRLSPIDVAAEHLARAEASGAELNAFTRLLPERAMAEARASASRYARGAARSMIDGVPISVKDLMHVAGTPTTAASEAADNRLQPEDSAVVARLSALGAIVFAKNNLLEYAYGVVHPSFGPAHNPYALDHSSGGSSSGSGVAVAAGIGLASIGTDTGGSVRNPAAWCGTVGIKPTYNALPTGGVIPLAPALDHVGVLARSVEDTRLVFDALTRARPARTQAHQPLRLGVLRLPDAQPAVGERFEAMLALLRADGVEVSDVDPLPMAAANSALLTILYVEALEVHQQRLASHWQGYSRAMRARVMAGAAVRGTEYVRARAVRHNLRQAWAPRLSSLGVDVVVLPTLPVTAPRERDLGSDPAGSDLGKATLYTGVFNLLGVPAVSVPVGVDAEGLPIGFQIAGIAGRDDRVLDVAARVEALRGPFAPPSTYRDALSVSSQGRNQSVGGNGQ